MKITRHKIFWALWVGAFLAYELPAVINGAQGDTFSEFFWGLFRINETLPLWQSIPIHATIVAFGIWLIGHLGFGLWGGPKGRILDGEPAELRNLPEEVIRLVHRVDALADGWAEGDKTRKAELWNQLHNANAAVWNRFDGKKPIEPPDFSSKKGQASKETAAEYERRIGRGPESPYEQVAVYMTEDPDGPMSPTETPRPICPGCNMRLAFNGTNWTHVDDASPICARDLNGYMTGMKGHRWKDTEGPHSVCEGCKLLYKHWDPSSGRWPCLRALPGTDYRL